MCVYNYLKGKGHENEKKFVAVSFDTSAYSSICRLRRKGQQLGEQ